MLEFASQDVQYLIEVYNMMSQYFNLRFVDRHCNTLSEVTLDHMSLEMKVFRDTYKCNAYAKIN